MAKEEINRVAGVTAMVAILIIMIILLAVLALVVVNALRALPWGFFTIACTMPIAVLMGWWMKVWRPGKVSEASIAGAMLLLLALVAGGWVSESPDLGAPLHLQRNHADLDDDRLRIQRLGAPGLDPAAAP